MLNNTCDGPVSQLCTLTTKLNAASRLCGTAARCIHAYDHFLILCDAADRRIVRRDGGPSRPPSAAEFSVTSSTHVRLGIICAVIASIAFSINDVSIKFMSGAYPLHELVLFMLISPIFICDSCRWMAVIPSFAPNCIFIWLMASFWGANSFFFMGLR